MHKLLCFGALVVLALAGTARADNPTPSLSTSSINTAPMSEGQCLAKAKAALDQFKWSGIHTGSHAWIAQEQGAVVEIECLQSHGANLAYLTIAFTGAGDKLDSFREKIVRVMEAK